jgi:Uma2 family endonuclease
VASEPPRKATYADVLAAPEHLVAEVLGGVLHLQPRPAGPHAVATTVLGELLGPPFRRAKGGPGGWILLDEPELHLGEDIVVPDLAGWRRTTMDHVEDVAYFEIRPDWVCEVLSPSTAQIDRTKKLGIYAREGVGHLWYVDPLARVVEVMRLERERWTIVASHVSGAPLRLEPFDAIEIDIGELWSDVREP